MKTNQESLEPERFAADTKTGVLGYMIALIATVVMLNLIMWGVGAVPCVYVVPISLLVAYPLWRQQVDRVLFERRAILAAVANPNGRVRHWFWRGRVASVMQVFLAIGLAIVLLSMLSSLTTKHWWLLGVDAAILALLVPAVRRRLRSEIQDGYVGLVARRWPLALFNVLLLTISFVLLDYYFIGWPDTRGADWWQVARHSFDVGYTSAECPAVGACIGALTMVGDLSRHLASIVIPQLPASYLRFLVWLLYLGWAGFGAYLYTRLLLGVVALLDRMGSVDVGRDDRTSRAFVYTILGLMIPYGIANIMLRNWEANLNQNAFNSRAPAIIDPCKGVKFDTTELRSNLSGELRKASAGSRALAEQRVDALLDQAFAPAEQGVDRYLDWYYSMLGDYSRLAEVVTGDIDSFMLRKLNELLIDSVKLDQQLSEGALSIENEMMARMEGAGESLGFLATQSVRASGCPVPEVNIKGVANLQRDAIRGSIATVAAGGVAAKVLVAKPASLMAGKLAAKGTVKIATKVMGKAAAKKGTSTLAAAGLGTLGCAPLGFFAPFCGVAAGVVTWVTVDRVVLEVDEFVNREDMRAELLAGLAEQRVAIRAQLVAFYTALIDEYANEIQSQADRLFIPARDG